MLTLEQRDPDDLVFPQDIKVAGQEATMRYGGLTKRELFAALFFQAVVSRRGLPPTKETAIVALEGSVALAEGLLEALRGPKAN